MKRINAELQEPDLISLMTQDPIGRNREIADFLSLIDEVDEGYSFFLNASWGDGKTVFVRQAAMVLEELNEHLPCREGVREAINGSEPLRGLELSGMYLPVYYNAWRNDTLGEPLPSLLASVATEFDFPQHTKEQPDKLGVAAAAIDALLKPLNLDVFSNLKDGLSGKDYLRAYEEKKGLQDKVGALIDAVLPERAQKLVLFIDELDRCSPVFALKLLEEVKFLFENDRVILVFSTDIEQLANAISGAYGSKFNGVRYLERFYDRVIPLSKPSACDYLTGLGMPISSDWFYRIVHEIANRAGFSMRTSIEYYESLKRTEEEIEKGTDEIIESLFLAGLVPVLQAIRIESIENYNVITRQAVPEPIFQYIAPLKELRFFLDMVIATTCRDIDQNNVSEEQRKSLITDICVSAFSKDPRVAEDAQRHLGYSGYRLPGQAERVL